MRARERASERAGLFGCWVVGCCCCSTENEGLAKVRWVGGNENVTIINFKCREGGRMMSQLVRRGEGVRGGDDVAVN